MSYVKCPIRFTLARKTAPRLQVRLEFSVTFMTLGYIPSGIKISELGRRKNTFAFSLGHH